jgi:hypothetical protein
MPLPPKAQKLILLLMDGAASLNEREVAVTKLVECLRKVYPDGYALLADWHTKQTSVLPPQKPNSESPYGRFIMPFGKYRGEMIKHVPVSYLLC